MLTVRHCGAISDIDCLKRERTGGLEKNFLIATSLHDDCIWVRCHRVASRRVGPTYFAVNHPSSEAWAKYSLIFVACSRAGILLAFIALSTTPVIGSPS